MEREEEKQKEGNEEKRIEKKPRNRLADAIISVWGISYLVTAVIRPDLVANVSPWLSCAAMTIMGVLLLSSLYINHWLLYGALSVRAVYGFVASWSFVEVWNVPYSPGIAAVSMAAMDFVAAVTLFYKAIEAREKRKGV